MKLTLGRLRFIDLEISCFRGTPFLLRNGSYTITVQMDINTMLSRLPAMAAGHKKEFTELVKKLRKRRAGDIESIVETLHRRAFDEISCLECGNCCRSLGPRLNTRDVQRLSANLGLTTAELELRYLKIDEDGDRVFQAMPCPFLGEDNHCFVYQNRPKACAEYPHTEGRQIRGRLNQLVKNSAYCPAVYRMLEMLKDDGI